MYGCIVWRLLPVQEPDDHDAKVIRRVVRDRVIEQLLARVLSVRDPADDVHRVLILAHVPELGSARPLYARLTPSHATMRNSSWSSSVVSVV